MAASDLTSDALERIVSRFGTMVRSVGRRRGLSDADLDELTQEVRLRLWRALGEREKIESVRTSYVYRAAVSAALDIIRGRRGRGESIELGKAEGESSAMRNAAALATGDSPDLELERRDLGERIDRAIDQLAEPRDVVVRLHLSGYDRFEIARLLGWSEPKVRNLIYRGLADLRTALLEAGVAPGRMV